MQLHIMAFVNNLDADDELPAEASAKLPQLEGLDFIKSGRYAMSTGISLSTRTALNCFLTTSHCVAAGSRP